MGHKLIHAEDAGNGYHGRCEYCDLPLVTDLGYNSWEGTICIPIDREKQKQKEEFENLVFDVYELAYEYLRFKNNWGAPFTKEGWWYIRANTEPSFQKVKKAKEKYKFDLLSEELIKHILSNPYNIDNLITLKKNRLVFKTE